MVGMRCNGYTLSSLLLTVCETWTRLYLTDGKEEELLPPDPPSSSYKKDIRLLEVEQRVRNQEPWTDCQVTAILFLSLPQAERKRR
jgi:hypothetical protein